MRYDDPAEDLCMCVDVAVGIRTDLARKGRVKVVEQEKSWKRREEGRGGGRSDGSGMGISDGE